jgi:hypothetical protein
MKLIRSFFIGFAGFAAVQVVLENAINKYGPWSGLSTGFAIVVCLQLIFFFYNK